MGLAELEADFGDKPVTGVAAMERDFGEKPEGFGSKALRIVGEEAAKLPGKVKATATSIGETAMNPPLSTVLPLTLGPGSTVTTRLGALAAGKMAEEPSTSPTENILTGAKAIFGSPKNPLSMILSPAVMEAALPIAGKVFRSTEVGRRAVNAADARNFGKTAGEVAPTLKPGTTSDTLQRTAEGQGLERIGQAKEAATQAVESKLPGGTPSRFKDIGTPPPGTAEPGEYLASARTAADASPFTSALPALHIDVPSLGKSMTVRDANKELSRIGDMMRGLEPLDPRFPKDVNLKQEYGKLANEIRDGIGAAGGPEAAAQWTAAQGQYRAGREISGELLSRPNLFRQGEFTMAELQRWLKNPENRADLARSLGGDLSTGQNLGAYNRLVDTITRGAGAGMVDELAGKAPGLLSGRGSYGFYRVPFEAVRKLFPNASTHYVGRVPLEPSAGAKTIADVIAERVGGSLAP